MYSDRVKQLVSELQFSGHLKNAPHQGESATPVCGDVTRFELNIQNNQVIACRFLANGCAASIAAAAALAELCQNQSIERCRRISRTDLLLNLGQLPPHKIHAVQLALDALKKALR